MLEYDLRHCLPSAEDLPDSDDTPVDNELQNLIPELLRAIIALLWGDRQDWFFGVDMGIYYDPEKPAIVPDGFLSLGVPHFIDEGLRLSYVLWEEREVPIMALEVVSKTRRGEYSTKKRIYAQIGIPYYIIYNPLRRRKSPLEVYKLEGDDYLLYSSASPSWLPELGLAIGRDRGTYQGKTREWLYWYDENNKRYLTPEERISRLENRLKSLGVDLNTLEE